MALTYQAIATVTVGSGGAADIEFTNIPGTYTDLCIALSLRYSYATGWDNSKIEFNSSSSNLSSRGIYGNNTTVGNGNWPSAIYLFQPGSSATSSTFGNCLVYIPNYTSSKNKSVSVDYVSENNSTDGILGITSGLWSNTAAITSVKFTPVSNNYVQHSTATLYGIKNTI